MLLNTNNGFPNNEFPMLMPQFEVWNICLIWKFRVRGQSNHSMDRMFEKAGIYLILVVCNTGSTNRWTDSSELCYRPPVSRTTCVDDLFLIFEVVYIKTLCHSEEHNAIKTRCWCLDKRHLTCLNLAAWLPDVDYWCQAVSDDTSIMSLDIIIIDLASCRSSSNGNYNSTSWLSFSH